jgi:hypothetical protein
MVGHHGVASAERRVEPAEPASPGMLAQQATRPGTNSSSAGDSSAGDSEVDALAPAARGDDAPAPAARGDDAPDAIVRAPASRLARRHRRRRSC